MKRVSLAVVLLLLLGQEASATCHVNCDDGYLGVCVERPGHCECSCIKELKRAGAEVEKMLACLKVSKDNLDEAVKEFNKRLNSGQRDFKFEFTDNNVKITIKATSGSKPCDQH